MKVSVVMVDGSFRENIFGADYFTQQSFVKEEFEVIWVEFYKTANPRIEQFKKNGLQVICLGNEAETEYHSSYCFNEGIKRAKGEVIIIPDADQIVDENYIEKVWQIHSKDENLVVYGYRFDDNELGTVKKINLDKIKAKYNLGNLFNPGGCLTVRRKWLLEINGYEQHWFFGTGFHANGTDIFHRLKNLGLKFYWNKDLILYHPWHPFTLDGISGKEHYALQFLMLSWRARQFETQPFEGIDSNKNCAKDFPFSEKEIQDVKNSVKPPVKVTGFKPGLQIMFPKLFSSLVRVKQLLKS